MAVSPMQSAVAAALATAIQVTGVSITYSDGVHSVVIAKAGVNDWKYDIDDGSQILTTWTARDYMLPASAIVLAGVTTLPARNHTITEVINGVTHTFGVLFPAGEPVYKFVDPGRTILLIHTREVS